MVVVMHSTIKGHCFDDNEKKIMHIIIISLARESTKIKPFSCNIAPENIKNILIL